jgi:hypothetical protein
LSRRIAAIEIQSDPLLRIHDPFARRLDRASTALLARYKEAEISKLEDAELYLLRNAIYARHGRPFDTTKLEKYSNRKGWLSLGAAYKPSLVSPIEACNALYLSGLHASRELGALGRGILIRDQSPSPTTKLLKASLCSCLGQPKMLVDCREHSGASEQYEFRDYVDLIIEFNVADQNAVEWNFLDAGAVASADLGDFKSHVDAFLSSAVNFNAEIQSTLKAHNLAFVTAGTIQEGPFWGTRVSFTPATIDALASDPTFLRELSTNMCRAIHAALELSGPFIPRIVKPAATLTDAQAEKLKIIQKPILFDDLRMKLTLDYIRKHSGEVVSGIEFIPRMIVLHRSNDDTFDGSYEALRPPTLQQTKTTQPDQRQPEANWSVHYLIDKDGNIYSLMQDFYIARHVVGLDRYAIGISNVGAEVSSLTPAQLRANVQLIHFLVHKHNNILWMIGASEAEAFKGSGLWDEKDIKYREDAFDVGKQFITDLRAQTADLQLKSGP